MHRRAFGLGLGGLLAAAAPAGGAAPTWAIVRPGVRLSFPADHGAHPDFRTEWWYVTGWLEDRDRRPLGFQVTFFRTRPNVDPANPSAFAPKQILFAHAAIADPRHTRLIHDQKIARAGFGLAEARIGDADVVLDDWRFWRRPDGAFRARVLARAFDLDLVFRPTQPVLLQGEAGFSQKGPSPAQASHYYSLPHLKAEGTLRREGRALTMAGEAWLDREWSSTLLDARAVGWDWTGLNLDDGSALMAFQVRDAKGAALWAGGALRTAAGQVRRLGPREVRFETRRRWRSPRTGATYPVEQTIVAAGRAWTLTPFFDDQELDSRAGGGPIYWEGAVRTPGGRGYLELTGYAEPLRL